MTRKGSKLHESECRVYGIPVRVENVRIRNVIRRVLRAIASRPRDWARIRRRIRAFEYFTTSEEPGTLGQWVVDVEQARKLNPQSGRPSTWGRPEGMWQAGGWIKLSRQVARMGWVHLVATIAHECGHVATRASEFEKRDGVDSEWASEMCADWHAFRWGFEKQIRAHAPRRSIAHHAALPGEVISMDGPEGSQSWKVDRCFYLRPISRRPKPTE